VLGWDSVVGNYASPYAAGSSYVLLHHCFGEINGKPGKWGHAIGGMGRITVLMAGEARSLGVQIDVNAGVRRVIVEQGCTVGVELDSGQVLPGRAVVANVNPKLQYQRLIDPADLPAEFAHAIERYRYGSGSFRISVALSQLPQFIRAPEPGPHHASGTILAPSLTYMARAWIDAQAQGVPRRPIFELMIPSVLDDSLAPSGAHVASLFCQHFRPDADWDGIKDQAVQSIFDTVQDYCPNFRASLLGFRALSPLDLEREFGLIGGYFFHGQLSLDQLFLMRPLYRYARYRGPLKGLYHCGSRAHAGGGFTGARGLNAARDFDCDLMLDWRQRITSGCGSCATSISCSRVC